MKCNHVKIIVWEIFLNQVSHLKGCGLHSCRIGREHAYFSKHLIVLYRWTESGLLEWMAHCYLLLNVQWCRKRSICWKRIRCRLKQGLTIKIIHSKRTLYMLRWFFRVRATTGTFMSLQFFSRQLFQLWSATIKFWTECVIKDIGTNYIVGWLPWFSHW